MILIVTIVFGVIFGAVGLGIGWLLTQIIGFTLFEASLFATICLYLGWQAMNALLDSFLSISMGLDEEDDEPEEVEQYDKRSNRRRRSNKRK